MDLVTLYSGLLLPWLGGMLWLAFADKCVQVHPVNRLRQTGYGFFLGYAVLFFIIRLADAVVGKISWQAIMLFLLFFSSAGGIALYFTPDNSQHKPPSQPRSLNFAQRILIAVLLLWTAIHVVFMSIEVFTQPLYPWDAWLAWVYRAKAWFLAGGMVDVVSPTDWAVAKLADTYTIKAWAYPLFPSVIPYWAALSLGHWSETLINLPALFAGIAIGMALYGQCREYGLGITTSVACCYLLYSIPLFGTHIALAGYADLWMTAYTGLGFVYLIRGIVMQRSGVNGMTFMLPGLLLLAMSIMVKNEGVVWFITALVLLLLANTRLRVALLFAVVLALLSLMAFSLGITHLDIPLIGEVGFNSSRLTLPFIGSFELELHDIWQVYLDNFFVMGSWNLMGLLILSSLLLSLQKPFKSEPDPVKQTAIRFVGLFIATQFFVFGLTDQGLWAETYTAINRLVLHFVPALLFAAFIIIHTHFKPHASDDEKTSRVYNNTTRLTISIFLAALITIGSGWVFLSIDLPESESAPKIIAAANFKFAFGQGQPVSDHLLVDEFDKGYALLTSGPVSIKASAFPALTYTWKPSVNTQEAAFFWRQKGNKNVDREDLAIPGTALLDLSVLPEWQGEITEFGFLLAGTKQRTVQLGTTTLEPASQILRLRLAWQDWTTFQEWSQQSINFLKAGDHSQVPTLPPTMMTWLLLSALLVRLVSVNRTNRDTRSWISVVGVLFMAAWMATDLPWTLNNIRQGRLSVATRLHVTEEQRASLALDGDIYRYIEHLKADVLGEHRARILILGDQDAIDYYLLRAKYHLLPHSARVVARLDQQLSPANLDYIIYFGPPGSINREPGWSTSWQDSMLQIDNSQWGVVYRVDSGQR